MKQFEDLLQSEEFKKATEQFQKVLTGEAGADNPFAHLFAGAGGPGMPGMAEMMGGMPGMGGMPMMPGMPPMGGMPGLPPMPVMPGMPGMDSQGARSAFPDPAMLQAMMGGGMPSAPPPTAGAGGRRPREVGPDRRHEEPPEALRVAEPSDGRDCRLGKDRSLLRQPGVTDVTRHTVSGPVYVHPHARRCSTRCHSRS